MNVVELEHTIHKRFGFNQFDIQLLKDIQSTSVTRQKLKWFESNNRISYISRNVYKLHKQKLLSEYINDIKSGDFTLVPKDILYNKFKVPKNLQYAISQYLITNDVLHVVSSGGIRYFSSRKNKHIKLTPARNKTNKKDISLREKLDKIDPCPFLNPGMYQRMYGHLKKLRLPNISINPMIKKMGGEMLHRDTNY